MPVYVDSGPSLGESLLGGLDAYRTARRQKRQDQQFEDDLARKLAIQNAELGQQGIHLLGKNDVLPFDVSQGLARQDSDAAKRSLPQTAAGLGGSFVDPTLAPRAPIPTTGTPPIMPPVASPIPSRAAAGRQNIPGQGSFIERMTAMVNGPSRGPRYERGNGYYIDNQPRFDREDAARTQKFADQFQGLLVNQYLAQGERDRKIQSYVAAGVPAERAALYVDNPSLAGNDPRIGRPQAPVIGSPEWRQAKIDEAKIDAQYGYHAPPQPSFMPFQGTDAKGNPIVRPFNTRTGQFGAVAEDVLPKPAAAGGMPSGMGSGGIGGIARVSGAITGMGVAHEQMAEYENAIKAGKASYDGLDHFKGQLATMFGADGLIDQAKFSAALADLNKRNPDLANYLRAASTWALEDSQLSGRASDFRTHMDDFVSSIGPNQGPKQIDNIQRFRQTRYDELAKFQPAMQAMADRITSGRGGGNAAPPNVPHPPNDPGGNIDLRQAPAGTPTREQQLWDAAVAKHGKERVLKEFGPRPE